MAKNKIYRYCYHQSEAIKRGEVFDCPDCYYRRPIANSSPVGTRACHFAIETGSLRGCTAKECYTNKIHFKQRAGKVIESD